MTPNYYDICDTFLDCQVGSTSVLKKNNVCTNINIFFSPTHQSNFENNLDHNEKNIISGNVANVICYYSVNFVLIFSTNIHF